jgi:hypothetical protein
LKLWVGKRERVVGSVTQVTRFATSPTTPLGTSLFAL